MSKNRLCDCGSGKRMNNCCKGRKKRDKSTGFESPDSAVINGFSIKPGKPTEYYSDGKKVEPKSLNIGISYKRESGKKKTMTFVSTENSKVTSVNETIKDYDLIYVADTNTKQSSYHPYKSICCVLEAKLVGESNGGYDMGVAYRGCFKTEGSAEKPENEAWFRVIQYIKTLLPNHYDKLNLGLVVDSDLSNIEAYNKGEKPIIGNAYLPENLRLIYASSDVGKDIIYNKLISIADKIANEYFKHLEKSNDDIEFNKKAIKLIENSLINA